MDKNVKTKLIAEALYRRLGSVEAMYELAFMDGWSVAADELWHRLRAKDGCIRDGDWCGGDVIEVVDQWLQDHGVDTSAGED